jgi:benzoyl-CoA reductase/2-hydroxyglutaryl-CoA dehydratase subunit BcrC/BadD/HgdB
MMLDYFQSLAEGIEARIRSGPQETTARKRLALELARLGIRLYSGKERVAWCGVVAPFELLNAMGVTSCFVEFIGAMLASTGSVAPMLEQAEQEGLATDCCGYHRAVKGATDQGLMPRPDFLIGTSAICSAGLASIENLAEHFGKDLFVIHVPVNRSPDAVRHLAAQFRNMTEFVAKQTGEALDPERLRNAVEWTNQAREHLVEVYRLAQAVPTPARRRDLINLGIVMALFLGTEAAVDIAKTYREEFTRKIEEKKPGMQGEKFRLLWLQNRIQFKNPLEEMLEKEYGAAVVADELNDVTWDPIDPADPYTGLAERVFSVSLCGTVGHRVEVLKKLARDYRVDGAINPCHWGCRQGTGARGLMEAGLREIGVPVLNLEVDCVDPRNFSEGQLRTRLEAFMETLAGRRARE